MKRIALSLSAVAFFCLHVHRTSAFAAVLIALPFLLYFAVKMPALADAPPLRPAWKIYAALTAIGACLWPVSGFAGWLRSITVFQMLQQALGADLNPLSQITAFLFAAAGLWFAYHMVCLFLSRFLVAAREAAGDFSKAERIALLAAVLVLIAAVALVYTRTDGFASPLVTRDLIYTSDSGAIVHENAYLSLSAGENDIRSPLFMLFAAPLMGLPYLLSRILPVSNAVSLLLVAAQAPLLAVSFLLLMKMVRGVSRAARIALPLVMLSTHAALLFTLMAEQYVIALFYLAFGLYGIVMHGRREQLLVLGAAGTMIPGAALMLLPEREGKTLREVIVDLLRSVLWGAVLLFALGGAGVLLRLPETLASIGRFSGAQITLWDRCLQFVSFVGQVFLAPQAGAVAAADGYMKWRLMDPQGVSVAGAALLLLSLLGFALNRRQRFAQIAMGWVCVSFVLLFVLGWGTAENGLTLYTLYFGWAFAVLIVYLTESLCRALKLERFSWIVYALAGAAMLWYNLPRLCALVRFAVEFYPL